jgi:hypothetical protein
MFEHRFFLGAHHFWQGDGHFVVSFHPWQLLGQLPSLRLFANYPGGSLGIQGPFPPRVY